MDFKFLEYFKKLSFVYKSIIFWSSVFFLLFIFQRYYFAVSNQMNAAKIDSFSETTVYLDWKLRSNQYANRGFTSLILGGRDVNGNYIAVCRVSIARQLLPGKLVVTKPPNVQLACYVGLAGEERRETQEYEYLVEPDAGALWWEKPINGLVPAGAVVGGYDSDSSTLFIGRAEHSQCDRRLFGFVSNCDVRKTINIGRVDPKQNKLFLMFAGEEVSTKEYEVLVYHPPYH